VAPGTAGMMSPGTTVWNSETMTDELGTAPLSMASQLYQPARPLPICAIHGQTCSGVASIVMAWVDMKRGSGIMASTGSVRRFSSAVATQVATAITKREEHLLYRCARGQKARDWTAVAQTLAADVRIRRRKSVAAAGFFVVMTGFRQGSRFAAASGAIGLRRVLRRAESALLQCGPCSFPKRGDATLCHMA